jgi:hypothetical protein
MLIPFAAMPQKLLEKMGGRAGVEVEALVVGVGVFLEEGAGEEGAVEGAVEEGAFDS